MTFDFELHGSIYSKSHRPIEKSSPASGYLPFETNLNGTKQIVYALVLVNGKDCRGGGSPLHPASSELCRTSTRAGLIRKRLRATRKPKTATLAWRWSAPVASYLM